MDAVRPKRDAGSGVSEAIESTGGPVAFEAICALPGFCRLVKRSATLDGSLPLRAAQHCSPVLEGNAAGFQIVLESAMTLRRTSRGVEAELSRDTAGTLQRTGDALEQLIRAGVLERGSYWHRVLEGGGFPIERGRLRLWSGFLVRPRAGTWLRVSRAFNRGSRLAVIEHLVADSSRFTPLLLEVEIRSLPDTPSWLESEIGCVLPVSPKVSMSLARLTRASGIAESFERFYDGSYFAEKAQRATGKYRKRVRHDGAAAALEPCVAKAFYLGPGVHEVQMLHRFCSPAGMRREGPEGEAGLPIGRVRNVGRLRGRWDGKAFTGSKVDIKAARASLASAWKRAGGTARSDALAFLSRYFFDPAHDEPYWLLQPWVFVRTPGGWSTVMDGCVVPGSAGMRGIIRTDVFHPLAMVYRLSVPQTFTIPMRASMLRFHPLPRSLQDARLETIAL
jgi:hypothetical protein